MFFSEGKWRASRFGKGSWGVEVRGMEGEKTEVGMYCMREKNQFLNINIFTTTFWAFCTLELSPTYAPSFVVPM